MSKKVDFEYQCSECGRKANDPETDCRKCSWPRIARPAVRDPHLKEALFDGDQPLFDQWCEGADTAAFCTQQPQQDGQRKSDVYDLWKTPGLLDSRPLTGCNPHIVADKLLLLGTSRRAGGRAEAIYTDGRIVQVPAWPEKGKDDNISEEKNGQ